MRDNNCCSEPTLSHDLVLLLKFFCGAIEAELEYDEQTYRPLNQIFS